MLLTHADLFAPVDLEAPGLPQGRRAPALRDRLLGAADGDGRRRAEAGSLLHARARARFETGPVAQIVVDRGGQLVLANQRRARCSASAPPTSAGRSQDLELSYRPVELRSAHRQVAGEPPTPCRSATSSGSLRPASSASDVEIVARRSTAPRRTLARRRASPSTTSPATAAAERARALQARARARLRGAAVDDRGARDHQRGAPVDQRGARDHQRGAPVDQRGARDDERGAPVDQRGARDDQRRAARSAAASSTRSTTSSSRSSRSLGVGVAVLDRRAARAGLEQRRRGPVGAARRRGGGTALPQPRHRAAGRAAAPADPRRPGRQHRGQRGRARRDQPPRARHPGAR